MDQLFTAAKIWQQLDPQNAGILEQEILAAQAGDETAAAALTARFAGYLTFGTAGLRAPLGPGTTRMNRVVVQRAAAGLADFATQQIKAPVVIIGYDARHGSQEFAQDSAAVFTAAGCRVKLFSAVTPTPVLAYAMQHFAADVGIMVTASHNPAKDNGYKVYLGARLVTTPTGAYAQITAPTDQVIAQHIQTWNTATQLPPKASTGWELIPETIMDNYVQDVAQFLTALGTGSKPRADLKIVYTALHGVGAKTFQQLLQETGFQPARLVEEQSTPDPAFPTVAFPNPEEPGALDLAVATAQATPGADLIIAHDPDADRLAVVVPTTKGWQRLTGDQVGLILGARLMPYVQANDLSMGNSIVSAPLLAKLAAQHDVPHVATPTGFKWICRVPRLGYGYEEAMGYAVAPHLVNDKDGLSASVVMADLAAELKTQGKSLLDYFDELTQQLGHCLTTQISVPVPSPTVGAKLVDDLRVNPPTHLAEYGPVHTEDYQDNQSAWAQQYGAMNMVEFTTPGQVSCRLTVRPSGTEPKVKCYVTVTAPADTPANQVHQTLQRLSAQAATLVRVE